MATIADEMRLLESSARPLPKEKLTYEQFLEWCDEDTHAEWVDGEVQMTSPVSSEHSDLTRFLTMLLGFFIEARNLGVLHTAPFQMRLREIRRGREPDLIFIATEHLDRIKKNYLDGPADVAIEIVSPDSIARDRGDKFVEYEAAGVREYWMIDPEREQAEFYRLGEEGRYRPILIGREGIFQSQAVEDFYLRVEWLWQEPLPKVATILKEMRVI